MEHIIAEKDYYMKEYRRLSDQLKNIPCKLSDVNYFILCIIFFEISCFVEF